MATVDLGPSSDWSNDGWVVTGGGFTQLWQATSDSNDTTYIKSPASKGGATVRFPQDISSVPTGAKINSVTFLVRAAKTSSAFRSLTVNVISNQNCARYTSRTIYPTQTISTYEIATYKKDPLGRTWDIHTLNKMLVRVFSYSKVADGVRVYEVIARVNYKASPAVTITSPTGTIFTPSPSILWTYTHVDADSQKSADIRIFTDAQKQQVTFDPSAAPPVYSAVVQGEAFFHLVNTSLGPDTYWVYIQSTSVFGAKTTWASRQFEIQGPAPGVPGDDNAGIAGTPGIGVPSVVPDSHTSSATLTLRDSSNLMSVQQADFETPADYVGYTVGTNCTVARNTVTSPFGQGTASLSLTASSAATMSALSEYFEVAAEVPVTLRAQFKAEATGRTVNAKISFYDGDFLQVGSTTTATGTDATGTWTEVVGNATTPADTIYAQVRLEVVSPANAEVHYVDHIGLMYGTGSAWTHGGHTSRNLLTAYLGSGDDPAPGTEQWVADNGASSVAVATTTGTGAHGTKTHRMTYTGVSPTLAFRATSSVFTTPSAGTNFTLNKPAGTADNDLLVAFVTSTGLGTITPPAGWTLVNTGQVNDDAGAHVTLWVLKRTGLAADPSTWTDGSLSTSSSRRTAVVIGYSGAAPADDQFIAENSNGSSSGNVNHTSATVTNTDSNAWRLAAFGYSDGVSGSTTVANTTSPLVPEISYVGKGTVWTKTTTATQWTVNRPANVASGDLMIASVSTVDNGGGTLTFSAPSGWTLVRHVRKSASSNPVVMGIFKRTAGASEPASWTANISTGCYPVISQCQAYRNAELASNQFVAESGSSTGSGSSITTSSITNNNSRAWRIESFAAAYADTGKTWTSTETIERADDTAQETFGNSYSVAVACYDSNADVSTGSHSRQGTLSASWNAAVSWIALLKPLSVVPPAGANETERLDNTNGSSNPWLTTAVYDSGGPIAAGPTSVTGIITPGSGTTVDSVASWVGIIKPATATTAGTVAAHTSTSVDISSVSRDVIRLAGGKVAMTASFLGSTPGTPYLIVSFYRANQLIGTAIAQGNGFNDTAWTRSAAVFDMPADTTRIRPTVQADGRAVSDTVSFDRVSIALGDSTVWRQGTARDAHPVLSVPQIQYADDDGTGYGPWADLSGQVIYPPRYDPLNGQLIYTDHTIVPLHNRKYRVQTLSYGLLGDQFASGWGPESSEISLTGLNWWLKDISDPSRNMLLKVKADPTGVGTTNTTSVFQPLGEQYPIVLSEGYKSDTVELTLIVDRTEYSRLKVLLNSDRTLLLQSDIDHSWWVRAIGDLDSEVQVTGQRKDNPLRFVKVQFVQVAPEE